jgi:hypothetical protein
MRTHLLCVTDISKKAVDGVNVLVMKVPGQLVRQGVERGSSHGVGDAGFIAGPVVLVIHPRQHMIVMTAGVMSELGFMKAGTTSMME